MAARTLAFALGALLTHQLATLPDVLYAGLAPLLLPLALSMGRTAIGAAFLLGIAWTTVHAHGALERRLPNHAQGADVVVDGRIESVARSNEERVRFVVVVEHLSATPRSASLLRGWQWAGCRIIVSWYRPHASIRPRAGERWRTALRLRQPRGLRNAGAYDIEHRALRDRTCATGYVRGASEPLQLAGSRTTLNRVREDIAQRIRAHLGDAPVAGVIVALAVGLREHITAQHRSTMQHTGTAHLMAISGLHIGLIAGLGLFVGQLCVRRVPRALLVWPASHWGALLALLLATAYAALAGFAIPTQRALLMLTVYLGAALVVRRIARHHGLALALLVVLVLDPLAINDPGAWLSFAAVAGLLWAIGPRAPRQHPVAAGGAGQTAGVDRTVPTAGRRVAQLVERVRLGATVQLAASLVVMPLSIACFAWQSWLAPLANFVAIPLTGFVVVPLTLAGVGLDPLVPAAAQVLFTVAATVMDATFAFLHWLPAASYALLPSRAPPDWALLAAAVGVAIVLAPMAWRLRAIGVLWMAPLLLPPSSAPPPDGLDVQILDVGQGLAVLVRTHRHSLVFDAGPSWSNGHDAGAGVVVPALHRQGLAAVDRVIISHRHQDHAGGLRGLLRSVRVGEVLGDPGRARPFAAPLRACQAGQHWQWDGYRFSILHPSRSASGGARDDGNNRSCVLRIAGAGGSVLMPADVEWPAEQALLRLPAGALHSDVLLVPHHGSRTSSTLAFLRAVAPHLAVNSSGHRNRFSLPTKDVVARYTRLRIALHDTACVGAMHLRLRAGRPAQLRSWWGDHLRFWHSRDRAEHCRDEALPAVRSNAERVPGARPQR